MTLDPKVRVLIADADPVLREQMTRRLLDGDVFSDAVSDSRSALERLREHDYAVLLLDLGLPQQGAESILEYLNRVPAARRPVILVLAEASAARSLDVEMVQIVLRKPFNLRHLSDLVKSCVHAATSSAPLAGPGVGTAAVV
jgi:DNA-binding response OmpR family regulator